MTDAGMDRSSGDENCSGWTTQPKRWTGSWQSTVRRLTPLKCQNHLDPGKWLFHSENCNKGECVGVRERERERERERDVQWRSEWCVFVCFACFVFVKHKTGCQTVKGLFKALLV